RCVGLVFFFQAEDGIRDGHVTGVQTCALPIFGVIDIGNILFGSEMVGAVRGIDPRTGHYFDDTKRYIDALSVSSAEKERIFEKRSEERRVGKECRDR